MIIEKQSLLSINLEKNTEAIANYLKFIILD